MVKKTIYAPSFTVQEEDWENGKDEAGEPRERRPISYCSNVTSFLKHIKEDREDEGSRL